MITSLRFVKRKNEIDFGFDGLSYKTILQQQIVTEGVVIGSAGEVIGSSRSQRWEDVPVVDEERESHD